MGNGGSSSSSSNGRTMTGAAVRATLGTLPNEDILPTLHNFQERWHASPGEEYRDKVLAVLGSATQHEHERQMGGSAQASMISQLASVITLLEGPTASALARETIVLLSVCCTLEGVRIGYV